MTDHRHCYRNPSHVVGLSENPDLSRLLRACGADEAIISGKASDYDRFLALAEALPLCQGHAVAEQVNRLLRDATGIEVPLCPHTARAIWLAWVEIHWYGRLEGEVHLPAVCPCCQPPEPTYLDETQVALLPDPLTIHGDQLGLWTRSWECILSEAMGYPLLILPRDYAFRRPDPYHAGEVIRKTSHGAPVSLEERNLLLTQALRVWGQWRLRMHDEQPPLLLRGGSTEAVTALLAYLNSSRALAPMVWIPDDPTEAGAVSGLYAEVGTGLDLSSCSSDEERALSRRAYSQVAPWGKAVVPGGLT